MVSDWHLGHPASQVKNIAQVEPYLDGIGSLVVAGDGREELVEAWREEADRLWSDLQEACEKRGVTFVALTGNHDPGVSSEGWMKLQEGRILVTHGDMIYDTTSPWSKELFAKRDAVNNLLAQRPSSSLAERWQCAREIGLLLRPSTKMAELGLLGYLKLALWPPERLVEIGRVWAGFAREGDRFLERFASESKILICGHFHRAGVFPLGEREVWNMGSLMKMSKSLCVDFDGENLSSEEIAL